MSELLPCPFCETQPEWINEAVADGHFYIRCPNCHIVMKEDRRDKVKGMWNQRGANATRLRYVQALKELIPIAEMFVVHQEWMEQECKADKSAIERAKSLLQ